MEDRFIITDEYGESLRTFNTRDAAEVFIKFRPECKIIEVENISHEQITEEFGDLPL
tara:strand:- start:1068 stop:1238 length:171 start_codon:yes stop_codon:yes gene_type:complete